jgi:hypothetical protein
MNAINRLNHHLWLINLSDAELGALVGAHLCPIDKLSAKDVERLKAVAFGDDREAGEIALSALGRCQMLQCRENSMPQVEALFAAGWLFEPVSENSEPWQWAWRRPARLKGSKGMRFASTSQAYSVLMKGRNLADKQPE